MLTFWSVGRVLAEPADLVLRNGEIVTLEDKWGTQEALAVTGHTIVALGSDAEMGEHIGPKTKVVDLNRATVIPGLIEGHGHFLSLGRAKQMLDLRDAQNYEAIVALVAQAAQKADPGAWIIGMGWHQDKWDRVPEPNVDGVPLNTKLNEVAPDNPVYLGHASGHAAFANDAALAAAGIDDGTADPDGGTIVRDANGKATGLLREKAKGLVEQAIAAFEMRLPPEERAKKFQAQVKLAGEEALRFGITSFHDAGSRFAEVDALRGLEEQNALPVRLYVMLRGASVSDYEQKLADYYMPAEENDFLAVRSIKQQIDGALGAHGAWLLEPYTDKPDSTGLVLDPVAQIENVGALALKHGFQINTHAIGTRANREVLNLYERVWQRAKVSGRELRWRIEHAQHIHLQDIPRFGSLGVIAAVQGVHCASDGPWIHTRLGEGRTELTSYRWRDLIDSGARLNNGTDAPVESLDPFASLHASIARVMKDGKAFYPKQSMTRLEALRSYTIDNAYSAFEEDQKGTITPGKLADLAVISGNMLTMPVDEIPNIKVLYTIVGGEIRYQAEE